MKANIKETVIQGLLMAAAVAVALPMPDLAFAQVDLNNSVGQVKTQIANIPGLISGICYLAGAVFVGSGVLKLKAHAENAANNPMHHGLSRVAVGAALVSLPAFIKFAQTTVFGSNGTAIGYNAMTPVN